MYPLAYSKVEMFAFEEKLVVALHHLGGDDPLSLTTVSGNQKRGLRFDSDYCDNHIELDDSLLSGMCPNCINLTISFLYYHYEVVYCFMWRRIYSRISQVGCSNR